MYYFNFDLFKGKIPEYLGSKLIRDKTDSKLFYDDDREMRNLKCFAELHGLSFHHETRKTYGLMSHLGAETKEQAEWCIGLILGLGDNDTVTKMSCHVSDDELYRFAVNSGFTIDDYQKVEYCVKRIGEQFFTRNFLVGTKDFIMSFKLAYR